MTNDEFRMTNVGGAGWLSGLQDRGWRGCGSGPERPMLQLIPCAGIRVESTDLGLPRQAGQPGAGWNDE